MESHIWPTLIARSSASYAPGPASLLDLDVMQYRTFTDQWARLECRASTTSAPPRFKKSPTS
eukprot:516381-Amphidinium_carterae.1